MNSPTTLRILDPPAVSTPGSAARCLVSRDRALGAGATSASGSSTSSAVTVGSTTCGGARIVAR
ncbi:hypothetical protein IOD13_16925 [Brevibacterium casei]|nr:hypothetical protein [Brevibacterium casei]